MRRLIITGVLLALTLGQANAQNMDRKWGVGLNVGSQQYSGDLGGGFYNFDQAFYGFVGLSVSRTISEHFDITLNGSLGEIGHVERPGNSFNSRLFQVSLNGQYNFFKYEDHKLRPFVFLGLGYMKLSDKRSSNVFNNMQLPDFGAGITYSVSPAINIVFQERFMMSDFDRVDGEVGGTKDSYLQHSLGLVFNFGKAKDADLDGISDRKDKCPDVAGLEQFMGCPDTDGDGIPDLDDKCPSVAGIAAFNGCPDTDADGVMDQDDACPKVAGLVSLKGCPDTDKDGVADKDDACPKVAGLVDLKGCPDSDKDGVADKDDACPNVAGLVNLKGCPDGDADGVADKDDACPDVAGLAKNKGCPEVKEEETKVLEQALHGVKFQSGRDVITTKSYSILNNVVDIMAKNKAYNLSIDGYTDSQGDDGQNKILSQKRAEAVKKYLTDKNIDASRLTANGYGEIKPIGDNKTATGRALNRRVELKIKF